MNLPADPFAESVYWLDLFVISFILVWQMAFGIIQPLCRPGDGGGDPQCLGLDAMLQPVWLGDAGQPLSFLSSDDNLRRGLLYRHACSQSGTVPPRVDWFVRLMTDATSMGNSEVMRPQERSFSINGLNLAALEWPGAGLPIIALHGWLDNAASFVPLASYLSGHHLLALDLPGHGHSDHLPAQAHYHLADNLHWINAVADAMGWQRFVLLGHSMGAAIASLAAAAMPQRVIGLSLIDGLGPIALTPQQEVRRLRLLFLKTASAKGRRPFHDIATAARTRQKYSRFAISLEAATTLVERNLRIVTEGYDWRYDEGVKEPSSHYYSEQQVQGILGEIESPALLISGEDGALKGWPGFAERRAALPDLQHELLPGGHHLHMETPQSVAMLLKRFYERLEGETI